MGRKKRIKFFFYHNTFDELNRVHPWLPKSVETFLNRVPLRLQELGIFIILAVVLLAGGLGIWSIRAGLQIKHEVSGTVQAALTHIETAQQALSDSDTARAENEFNQSVDLLKTAHLQLTKKHVVLYALIAYVPPVRHARMALDAATYLAEAGSQASRIAGEYQDFSIDISGATTSRKQAFLSNASGDIDSLTTKVNQAQNILETIPSDAFGSQSKKQLEDVKAKVSRIQSLLTNFKDLLLVFQDILTGNKNVLLLFQNNRELRPSGGFLGTFGMAKLQDGAITTMHVSSIYDLDGQLRKTIVPPEPLFAVNKQWYMRDSNWFADFPTSANKVSSFYEKEGGETPDFVIALTPELVVRLLRITGPIELPSDHVILTADNFVDTTQFLTSVAYDKEVNAPKQMISNFLPLLITKISESEGDKKVAILKSVYDLLAEKELQLYSRDPTVEHVLQSYGWSGKISDAPFDYLSVNVANLSGTKISSDIIQHLDLETHIAGDGSVEDTLTITQTNPLQPEYAFRALNYVKIFVPEGSRLVSAQGFSPAPFDRTKLVKTGDLDPLVQTMEDIQSFDNASNTTISKESGKTTFANWIALEGGQSITAKITYRLPKKVAAKQAYEILVQKQPGLVSTWAMNINLDRPWGVVAAQGLGVKVEDNRARVAEQSFSRDMWYGMVLSKN